MLGNDIFIDHPLEIIAKKIYYRSDSITMRDLFDIAFVYTKEGNNMVNIIDMVDKIKTLNKKYLKVIHFIQGK